MIDFLAKPGLWAWCVGSAVFSGLIMRLAIRGKFEVRYRRKLLLASSAPVLILMGLFALSNARPLLSNDLSQLASEVMKLEILLSFILVSLSSFVGAKLVSRRIDAGKASSRTLSDTFK